ncbi:MAG: glutathione S-transferase family protein [Alphaproteobacteria bacterium]
MPTFPILYGAPLSPFVRKVAIVLEEKNISFKWKPLPPRNNDPDFMRISPLGKIPAYKDKLHEMADSSVICQYLEKAYPSPALYPSDSGQFARCLWFEEYFDSGMIKPLQIIYFEGYFNPRYRGRSTDDEKLAQAYLDAVPYLTYLEGQIEPNRWLAGDMFSLADISVTVAFDNLFLDEMQLGLQDYPKLSAHIEKVYARPSVQKASTFMREFLAQLPAKPA